MVHLNRFSFVTFLLVLGLLLGACAPATTPVTTSGGTPMASSSGGQVQAQNILANPGCFNNPERIDGTDQGLVLWCVKPPSIEIPPVILGTAAGAVAVDGPLPFGDAVALVLIARELLILANQPNAATLQPDAYLVPWEMVLGDEATWAWSQTVVSAATATWVQQNSQTITGVSIKVTLSLIKQGSGGCPADRPYNSFQVTLHLTRGSGSAWGPRLVGDLLHCLGSLDEDGVMDAIKEQVRTFLALMDDEAGALLRSLLNFW